MLLLLALACKDAPTDTAQPVDADGDGWLSVDDCDDADPRRYPEAVEVCGDGVVNRCGALEVDAEALCGWPEFAEDGPLVLGDVAGDAAGTAVALAQDTNGDGLGDLLVAAPHDRTFATRGGVLHLVQAPFAGERVLHDSVAQLYYGDAFSFPMAFVGPGDLNGDGFGDIALTTEEEGQDWHVRLLSGQVSGDTEVEASAFADITSSDKPSRLGWAIDGGDLDGDGAVDLVLGDPIQSFSGADSGGVYLVFGHFEGEVYAEDHTVLRGTRAGARAGEALAIVGDTDGDGTPDLVVGAPLDDLAGEDAGATILVQGPLLPHFHQQLDGPTLLGAQPGARLGRAVAAGGDVDGDGYQEALLGAAAAGTGALDAGAVYLVEGEAVGDPTDAAASFVGLDGEDLGLFACGLGDLDGDGRGELALSAADGSLRVFYGPRVGVFGAADADVVIPGEPGDGAVRCGVDLSGDRLPDLALGRPGYDARAEDAGAVSVLLAPGI